MYTFSNTEMRSLSLRDLSSLKTKAKNGDHTAQWQLAMCILYGQNGLSEGESLLDDLESYSASEDENALLLGYACEHAIGAPKDYARAVNYYSKAYDQLYNIQASGKASAIDGAKAMKELESRYDELVKKISQIVALKDFCQYKDKKFIFPWTDTTRKSLENVLPQLSKEIAEFGELCTKAITDLQDDNQGRWEFLYQDTLLMPIEVIKALAARDQLEHYFRKNGHQVFPTDVYFNNALGRCLIDDDDAHDNDYIIGGMLNMAGHEDNALWQYRVGLWYEYCDNNLEPKTAAYWYEQAKREIPAAKTAIERLQNSLNYRILINTKEGTAKDCQALMKRSSKNPQNSIGWVIESALRGDESAIQQLENDQLSPKGQSHIFVTQSSADDTQPYYTLLEEETVADKKAARQWEKMMQAEKEEYRKRIEEEERRKAEEERKRIEAERKAKEEAIRKAKEAEEAKRRAEEAKRRAEEEAKRRAAEEARRKAEEAERKKLEDERKKLETERKKLEAERKAKEEAIRKAKEAEEAKRRAEEKRLRKEAEELKKKKEALRERKQVIAWVIAALLGLIAGTWMAFALKEPNDSWGNSLALGYTLGLVVFFAIIYGLFSIIGIDVEGNDVEKWRTTLCRSAFVLSLIGIIIFCIIKGTISLSTTALSIYLGLFVTSCTNGISNFFSKKK